MGYEVTYGHGHLCVSMTGTVGHTGGEQCNLLNPEGEHVIITACTLYVETSSTGAANLNVGIGTTAQHDQTELVSAKAINGVTGSACNGFANGDAADALVIWGEDEYLVANASADCTGFVGKLYVEYVHV